MVLKHTFLQLWCTRDCTTSTTGQSTMMASAFYSDVQPSTSSIPMAALLLCVYPPILTCIILATESKQSDLYACNYLGIPSFISILRFQVLSFVLYEIVIMHTLVRMPWYWQKTRSAHILSSFDTGNFLKLLRFGCAYAMIVQIICMCFCRWRL